MDFLSQEHLMIQLTVSPRIQELFKARDVVLRMIRDDQPMTEHELVMLESCVTRLQAELTARRARDLTNRNNKHARVAGL